MPCFGLPSLLLTLTTMGSLVAGLTAYYVVFVSQRPRVQCGNEKMRRFLGERVAYSERIYWPAVFLWSGTLQTIFGLSRRFPSTTKLPYEREVVRLRDGGQVGLDFLPAHPTTHGHELSVVFLPGLTSSSQTSYVKSLVIAITRAGADVFVLNYRGLGGVPLATPKSYSAATINDLVDTLAHLQKRCPGQKFLVIGTSFGGITLNRYLIKEPEAAKAVVLGGLVISTPFDLKASVSGIEGPLKKHLLNYPICGELKRKMQYYDDILTGQPWYSLEKLAKCKSLRDFDRHITSQAYGFTSEVDYYEECSSAGKLHLLPVPLYSFSARDDPFQYEAYLPVGEAEAQSSKLALITTTRGGHLGFLQGLSPFSATPFHFMEKFTQDFVEAVLQHPQQFANA